MYRHQGFFAASVIAVMSGVYCASAADAVPANVTAAVHDRGRTPWDIMRDDDRKPAEVLAFAQIKPGMIVVDLAPQDGYYTRMLAKLVGPKGKVYAVVPGADGESSRSMRIQQRDAKPPSAVPIDEAERCVMGCYAVGRAPYMLPIDEMQALENITEYSNVVVLWEELGAYGGDLSVPEQADVVFTVDAYHDLHAATRMSLPEAVPGRPINPKPLNMAAVNKSIFGELKPGGIYLVVDHAAAKGTGFSAADSLHRTEADATKAEATGAGFVFDGENKALARAGDDHSKAADGPYAVRDKTDQYILRFKKPVNAPNTDKRPKDENAVMKNYYGNTIVVGTELKGFDKQKGTRIRIVFYNEDHTYQEFGKLGEGPGPMQSGTWYFDADGHNCQLHQFPLDEHSNVVCHVDVFARPVGVVMDQNPGGGGRKVEIVPGHVLEGYILPGDKSAE